MAFVMSVYFETSRSANESNDVADLAKVLPESYQKSNEFSVNRKCAQNVAADDRRTFTDKDKVRLYSKSRKRQQRCHVKNKKIHTLY